MRAERPNTTQRSWSNYVGDKPIERWKGKAPIGESRYYADSALYGPGASLLKPREKRRPQDSAIRRIMQQFSPQYNESELDEPVV